MNKAVSVIIPIYNMEEYAEACIRSVMGQSYKEIDIVAVNDGSTDASEEIVKRLASEDSRIRLFSKPNAGLAHTRNFGIEKAVGDYILFLDCDDLFEADSVTEMVKCVEETGADIVSACMTRFNSDGGERLRVPSCSGMYSGESMRAVREAICIGDNDALLNLYCKMYRRELLINNGIKARKLVSGDDAAFALEAVFAAESIYFADKLKHYRYRDNPTSFTRKHIPIETRIEYSKEFFRELDLIVDKFGADEYRKYFDLRKSLSVYGFAQTCVTDSKTKKDALAELVTVCNDSFHVEGAVISDALPRQVRWITSLAKKKKVGAIYSLCILVQRAKKILE